MLTTHLLVAFLAMAGSAAPALDEPFALRIGQSQTLSDADIGLHFVDVTQDSRCPRDVSCIVAGEAHVVVRAEAGPETRELIFKVPPAGSDTLTFEGFTLTVTALEPQTEETRKIEAGDFEATIVVTEKAP